MFSRSLSLSFSSLECKFEDNILVKLIYTQWFVVLDQENCSSEASSSWEVAATADLLSTLSARAPGEVLAIRTCTNKVNE